MLCWYTKTYSDKQNSYKFDFICTWGISALDRGVQHRNPLLLAPHGSWLCCTDELSSEGCTASALGPGA